MKNKTLLLNDALKIFYSKFPNFKVKTVIRYDRWFVFDTVPRDKTEESTLITSLISIDEISGEMMGFNPLNYDRQKYLIALSKAISIQA